MISNWYPIFSILLDRTIRILPCLCATATPHLHFRLLILFLGSATLGVEVRPLAFTTNFGICFNVWDTAGQEKSGGFREAYYTGRQCGIIMFDVISRITYQSVPDWHRDIVRVCENIPIVLCGNKVDLEVNNPWSINNSHKEPFASQRSAKWNPAKWLSTERRTCNISKSQQSLTTTSRSLSCGCRGSLLGESKLFFRLSSSTTYQSRNPALDFIAAPALAPAEVQLDASLMAQYEAELQNVRHPGFPDFKFADFNRRRLSPFRGRGWTLTSHFIFFPTLL